MSIEIQGSSSNQTKVSQGGDPQPGDPRKSHTGRGCPSDKYAQYISQINLKRKNLLRMDKVRSNSRISCSVAFIAVAISTIAAPAHAATIQNIPSDIRESQTVYVDGVTVSVAESDTYSVVRRAPARRHESYRFSGPGLSAPGARVSYDSSSIIGVAAEYIGVPYRFGGADPSYGFDCSGLVKYVFARFGVALPHSVSGQARVGRIVSRAEARPGDIITMPGHNGFYAGPGLILHAPDYGRSVQISRLWTDNYYIVRIGG